MRIGEACIMLLRVAHSPRYTRQAGRAAILLLLIAVVIVAVGALTVRLGPHWPERLLFRGPPGIVIHHTASAATVDGREVNAELIAEWHEERGFEVEYRETVYTIGYHYVILPDGTIEPGRPEWMTGAHTRSHNDNLGICLVGNFDSGANPAGREQPARPTDQQMEALSGLLGDLMTKYRLTPRDIYGHRELAQTACPGDRFSMDRLRDSLQPADGSSDDGGGDEGDGTE